MEFISNMIHLMKKKHLILCRYDFNVMGAPCEIHAYCSSRKHFDAVKDAAISELQRLDRYYTNYTDSSFTAEINRSAGNDNGIIVDAETAALLNYSAECFKHSQGLFDITSGTLRQAWDYNSDNPKLPEQTDLDVLLTAVGWEKVKWESPHLHLPKVGMVIDFGGVVKEYAADVAAGIFLQHDVQHGFINLGGDMRLMGPHADGSPWRIGIRNPNDSQNDLAHVLINQGAVVTSGDYERYLNIDGKRYSHILNPKTGWPAEGFSSVTVFGDYCLVAGSASTIASIKPEAEAIEWLNDLGLPYICVSRDGTVYRNC